MDYVKKTHIFPRITAIVLAFLMVLGSISFPAKAENSVETIAAWEFTTDNAPEAGTLSVGATTGSGTLSLEGGPTYGGYSSSSLKGTDWTKGGEWGISNINAANYENLTFSAKLRSSGTGPRKFQLQYSVDENQTWNAVADSGIEVTSTTLTEYWREFQLPTELAGKTFSIRVVLTDTTTASGEGKTFGTGGVNNINNITISGTKKDSGSSEPGQETCAAVTASVESGEVVSGTELVLSCATEGADIYYKESGAADYTKYTSAISLTKAVTIQAYASKDGFNNSTEESFTYTIKSEGTDTSEPLPEEPSTELGTKLTTLANGDSFIVYSPANKKVMASAASGTKLTAIAGEASGDNKLEAPAGAAVLTAIYDDVTGYYTFTSGGKYLTSGAKGSSLTFESAASDYSLWTLEKADENGGYFVKSVNASYNNMNQYLEYYNTFTTYKKSDNASADAYLMYFFRAKEGVQIESETVFNVAQWSGSANYTEVTSEGGISGDVYTANDMKETAAVYTAMVNGSAVQPYTTTTSTGSTSYYMGGKGLGSGSSDYMQFALSSKGYGAMDMSLRMRASNTGAGSWQFQYSTDGTTFTNFTTGTYAYKYTAYSGGSSSEVSKEDVITDGVAKTSMAPGNYITFHFDIPEGAENAERLYIRLVPGAEKAKGDGAPSSSGTVRVDSVVIKGSPVISSDICSYVKADPQSGETSKGSELTLTSATAGADIYYSLNGGAYQKYDTAAKLTIDTLPADIRTYAVKEGITDSIKTVYQYTNGKVKAVKASPNGGAVQKGTKVTLSCETEGADIYYSEDNGAAWTKYTEALTLAELPKSYQVKAVKAGYEDSSISNVSFTERSSEKYNLYFGQLHSHTSYSDGAGTCEEAYRHASNVDNLDYLAVTDHSNSFDNADSANILDGSMSEEWKEGHQLADKYTTDDFVSLFGYEMTWSNGLGHVNTFNTDGFQSRTQSAYTNYSTALQNYYTALKTDTDSITQFNHPGTTFGDFSDFSYYDEDLDDLITMIEVGNGEGAIGSSGYFPSYEYYQRALDKGWHVAPTNNQDNHKGLWGDANTARSVVMADSLTRENIYDAMRNYRVYATEDNDLSIYYTLNGYEMGSILSDVGDKVTLKAELSDTTDASIGKVQVITNGGLVLDEKTVSANKETIEFEIDNNYSYYYLKITETDGDIAVTAPVWVGEVEAAGINSISTDEVLPVQNEKLTVDLGLYNNENTAMTINAIEFSVNGEVVHKADLATAGITSVASMGTADYSFDYTYSKAGGMEMNVTVKATLNGVEKIYNGALKLTYVKPEMVTNVIIDGIHGNDYVTGYYGANVNNFTKIAGNKNVKVTVAKDEITPEMLENCSLLIISAPAKKDGTANAGAFKVSHFSDDFIKMVKDYTDKGGALIACGIADYQDTSDGQTTTEMNKLLAGIGATTTLYSDEAYDTVNNGNGQPYRLYLKDTYNADSEYLAGADAEQEYSAYSGCTVNLNADAVAAGKAEALVKGYDTTYSIDSKGEGGSKGDNSTVVEKGNVVTLAHETLGSGADIFVSGTVFISDFEVKAELDNNWDLPYLNRTIAENILDKVKVELPLSAISDVRKGEEGDVYRVEGYVTAGTANKNNKFFDAICIQDETGGITVFPYAEEGLELGTKVSITGYVDAYQGEKEIQVINSKVLTEAPKKVYAPEKMSAADAMNYDKSGGKLVRVTGKVVKVEDTDGTAVNKFWLDDGSGTNANIFIDGYITSGTTGKNTLASVVKTGETVSAVGLVYAHPEGESDEPVICLRVRNCDEITKAGTEIPSTGGEVIKKDTVVADGAPKTSLDTDISELYRLLLTEEEKRLVADGSNAEIYMEVKPVTELVEAVRTQIVAATAEKLGEGVQLRCMDISLFKQIGEKAPEEITDITGGKVTLTITIPEDLRNMDTGRTRSYQMVRVHNGAAEVLDTEYHAEKGTLTFASDKFSIYAIAYKDADVNTGNSDNNNNDSGNSGNSGTVGGTGTVGAGNSGAAGNTGAGGTDTNRAAAINGSVAKTGDTSPVSGYVVLLAASVVIAVSVIAKRRKSRMK